MPLSYYAGMALIPIGCASSAVGLLLMKASQDLRPDLPPWRSWRWLLGFMLLGVVATSVDVIVLGILPLSVYAPFAGLTIVISLLVSASGLITQPPETLSASDVRSIALVLIGVTLVSAFGPEPSSSHVSFEAVLAAYTSPQLAGLLAIASTGASTQLCMYPAGFPTLLSCMGGAHADGPLGGLVRLRVTAHAQAGLHLGRRATLQLARLWIRPSPCSLVRLLCTCAC